MEINGDRYYFSHGTWTEHVFNYLSSLLTRSLSQKYYAAVRIHMGHFTTSKVCDKYEVFRTTFLDFTVKDKPYRHVEQWKDDEGEDTSKCTMKVIL